MMGRMGSRDESQKEGRNNAVYYYIQNDGERERKENFKIIYIFYINNHITDYIIITTNILLSDKANSLVQYLLLV